MIRAHNNQEAEPFEGIPPFPDDVQVHPLYVIDLKLLEDKDEQEIERLWTACTTLGFFYIKGFDTSLPDGIFKLAKDTFDMPMDEKLKFDTKTFNGYKAAGNDIVDEKGTPDLSEFFNISKADIANYPNLVAMKELPEVIDSRMDLIKAYVEQCNHISITILECLEIKLQLNKHELVNMHKITNGRTGGQFRIIKAIPSTTSPERQTHGSHTDIGTVTIVHNRLGGLQISIPGTPDYKYIKPMPGHAVINLGDTMGLLTCGKLVSNMHRVISPPKEQAHCIRYSTACFAGVNYSLPLKPLHHSPVVQQAAKENNRDINEDFGLYKEWLIRRTKNRRKDEYKGPQTWYNARGTEHLDNPDFKKLAVPSN